MKKIFIITKSGHPPTVDSTKKILETLNYNIPECNTYAGAPLMFPTFIINNYNEDSSIVLVEENKITVFEGETLKEAIAALTENMKTSTFETLYKLKSK